MPKQEKAEPVKLRLKSTPSKEEASKEQVVPTVVPGQVEQEPEKDPRTAGNPSFSDIRSNPVSTREKLAAKRSGIVRFLAILTFLVLGGAIAWARYLYLNTFSEDFQLEVVQYGLIAVAVAYLLCLVLAIKAGTMEGILAILVPGYPFYYILMVSSNLFVRVIVAVLLVGFGVDLAKFLQAKWDILYNTINGLITG